MMNFNEALRAMLKGKRVRADCWEPNEYIMLDADNNDFIDEDGNTYLFSDSSTYHDWYYSYSMAGTVLKHNNGNFYKFIVCPDNTYSIVNIETYMVVREHIREDMLKILLRVEGYTVKQW